MGIIILQAVCAAYVFVAVLQIGYRFNNLLNFKPFICTTCMSGWLCLPLLIYHSTPIIEIPFDMAISMTVGYVVSKLIDRL